jgi:esterase/lipase superfamily enzyme
VFYATDRNNTGSNDPKTIYGGDRSNVKYGTCDVTVPKDHRVGELEAPSYFRLEFVEDPAKHVILSRVTEQSASDFYNEVQAKVAASKGRSAFVFVHGYNVTFSDAARRTAQMSYDLKFDGAPVFFSWPSQGSLLGYTVDEANIEYARSDLKTFIAEFARTSTADNIYLVAHSMGNRALTAAIADLFREAPDVKAKIREIILAAPDIDADVFKRDIAPAISGQGQAVTLYASSNDWALRASKKFHGYARAGDTGQALTVVPGIATIDSSEVETDFLGHSYFAESTSIIADMFDILSGVTNPEDRRHLVPVEAHFGRYWKIPKVSD